MAMLDKLSTEDNLHRAWRWIKSNPDASYKRYFRQYYGVYAVADIALLKNLRDHLRRNIYEPTKACKLFFPEPSGVLRPYSLLTLEDQIVYQAAVNLVAEKLLPKVRRRYYEEVFGHLYAGKTSVWFYRKWSKGYKALNNALRDPAAEVALSAVVGVVVHEVQFNRPLRNTNPPAELVLKELGLVKRSKSHLCGIDTSFRRMLGKAPAIKWKSVFRKNYAHAERQAVMCGPTSTWPETYVNPTEPRFRRDYWSLTRAPPPQQAESLVKPWQTRLSWLSC